MTTFPGVVMLGIVWGKLGEIWRDNDTEKIVWGIKAKIRNKTRRKMVLNDIWPKFSSDKIGKKGPWKMLWRKTEWCKQEVSWDNVKRSLEPKQCPNKMMFRRQGFLWNLDSAETHTYHVYGVLVVPQCTWSTSMKYTAKLSAWCLPLPGQALKMTEADHQREENKWMNEWMNK